MWEHPYPTDASRGIYSGRDAIWGLPLLILLSVPGRSSPSKRKPMFDLQSPQLMEHLCSAEFPK